MEREIAFSSEVLLKGTLGLPEKLLGKSPAVLIIPGSGPLDRNGNMKRFKSNLYKDLSKFFVSLGYVTLRYDKRGSGESEGDFYKAGMKEYVKDAQAAVEALKSQPEVDPDQVVIAGHSEGALLGSAVAEKVKLDGLIMLAGAGHSLPEATAYQRKLAYKEMETLKGLKGVLVKKLNIIEKDQAKAEKLFEKMRTTDKDTIRFQLIKMNAKWWREHEQFDHLESLRKITCPVLAVTGSKDAQADPSALKNLTDFKDGPDIETYIVDDMNHALKEQKEELSMSNLKERYKNILHEPIHQELKIIISTWLANSRSKARL